MTDTLKKLAGKISGSAVKLKDCGWDRRIAVQLIDIMGDIRDESLQVGWIEAIARAETLIGVLNEFVQDASPTPECLAPIFQSVFNLSSLLVQGQFYKTDADEQAKKQLEIMRGVLDAHSIVSIAAADGTIVDVNQKFCEVSGYSKEELIGRNHRIIKSGHHSKAFFIDMWQTIVSGKIWQGEIQNRTKQGNPYWVQSTIVPVMGDQGSPVQYFSIRTDVTRQKQMQADSRRQGRLLNLLRQALQEYNRNHDFKGTTARLLDGLLLLSESAYGFIAELLYDPQGTPYLKTHAVTDITWDAPSQHQYQQAQGMVFRKMDTLYGAVVRSGEPVIANDPARDPRSGGLPNGHPPLDAFLGMPVYSGQTLLGMVGLANRPGGYDETQLEFIAPFIDTCANLMAMERSRHGQQLANNDLAHSLAKAEHALSGKAKFIADMSYELRNLLNSILGHSQLLQMQDGLDAYTYEQAGEIVSAGEKFAQLVDQLLAHSGDDLAMVRNDAVKTLVPIGQMPKPQQQHRILVVEDDPANQAVLRIQMDALGYPAHIVSNGNEALSHWQAGGYELLLTDLNMPDMDGLELTRFIRAAELGTGKHLPIIGISAVYHPDDLAICLQTGMDDTLPKPIELESLRQMLQSWLPQTAPSLPPATTKPLAMDSNQVLDAGYLIRTTGSMTPYQIRKLVDLFTTSARAELSLCRQHLQQKDAQALALAMHKLKSSARTVGAMRFSEQALSLETAAHEGRMVEAVALLMELEHALTDVEAAIVGQPQLAEEGSLTTFTQPDCVLVVDDDVLTRRQITLLLASLGITDILVADSGIAGLKEIGQHRDRINLLLCDLNMPEMDGIEFLRRMSEIGYQDDIILVSGVDDRLLQSAVELAGMQGLHLLGSLGKPLAREALIALLNKPYEKSGNAAQEMASHSVTPEDILEGLNKNEFDVYFQPIVDASTLKPVGLEALARWRRQGVVISAGAFIPAAEHYGLIGRLSEVLLIKAFFGGVRLNEAGFKLGVSVNLSAHWLSDVNLADFIQASLHATGLKVGSVMLEITESGVMGDLTKALDIITRLRLKGFKLSIDDFGTGYSSMEQLQRIPFSELKLDRSFVQSAADNPTAYAILTASVEMASKLKLTTVAEGVETTAHLDLVRGLGCDLVQGWLIAKAMPIDELIDWLRGQKQSPLNH